MSRLPERFQSFYRQKSALPIPAVFIQGPCRRAAFCKTAPESVYNHKNDADSKSVRQKTTGVQNAMSATIRDAVYRAIEEINELRPPEKQIAKAADSALFSRSGPLDSLGLLNFIVSLETAVEEMLGVELILSDKKFNINDFNPFATVASLIDYLKTQLGEPRP
jgi:hypothetical protein